MEKNMQMKMKIKPKCKFFQRQHKMRKQISNNCLCKNGKRIKYFLKSHYKSNDLTAYAYSSVNRFLQFFLWLRIYLKTPPLFIICAPFGSRISTIYSLILFRLFFFSRRRLNSKRFFHTYYIISRIFTHGCCYDY